MARPPSAQPYLPNRAHTPQIQYQAETQLRALQMGGTPPGHTPGTPQLPPMMMQAPGPAGATMAAAGRSDLAAMLMSSSAAVMPGGMSGAGVPGVNAAAARLQYSFPSRPMTAPGREGLTTCLSCDAPILNASRYVMQPGHTLGGGYALWSPQARGIAPGGVVGGPPLRDGAQPQLPELSGNMTVEGVDGKFYKTDVKKGKGGATGEAGDGGEDAARDESK